jgi:hypothetical protein
VAAEGTDFSEHNRKLRIADELMRPAGFNPVDEERQANLGAFVEDLITDAETNAGPMSLSVDFLVERFAAWLDTSATGDPYQAYGCPPGQPGADWLRARMPDLAARLAETYPLLFQ